MTHRVDADATQKTYRIDSSSDSRAPESSAPESSAPDSADQVDPKHAAWLLTPQPRLGAMGLVTLLALVNALIPLSLDMYTPSVPEMPAHFHTTATMVTMTVLGFFLFFAIGLLIFGPLSDRIGRRPVLVWGMAVYVVASVVCALSPTIGVLIGARIVQALGAGAVNAVSTALVKDCFVPAKRQLMLTIIQTMAVLGPVIAPLAGGIIVRFGSWRLVFWVLAIVGAACFVPTLMFRESLPPESRTTDSAARIFRRLVVVARIPRFSDVLLVASFFSLAFMQYIAVGSYVYVDYFGTTAQEYTYFFAGTAAVSVLGPMAYLRFGRHVSVRQLTYVILGLGVVDGALIATVGHSTPVVFCLLFAVFAICEATVRPYTTNMMLGYASEDAGSASSLINFMNTAFGSLGMALIMLPFPDYVTGIGILMAASMLLGIVFWRRAMR